MGKHRTDLIARIAMVVGGFTLFAVGLLGFDWRIASVVCGVLLLAGGLVVPYDDEE